MDFASIGSLLGKLRGGLSGAGALGKKMAELQQRLEAQVVKGEAGAGLVSVTMNCARSVLKVEISPTLKVSASEDLVRTAMNEALAKVSAAEQQVHAQTMQAVMADMPALLAAFASSKGNQLR